MEEKDEKENKYDHLTPEQQELVNKANEKRKAKQAAKALEDPDAEWTILEDLLQEIQAGYLVANPDVKPPVTKLVEDLKKEVRNKYSNQPKAMDLLLNSIPSHVSLRLWLKKDGWDDAVWKKIRDDALFSPAKRAEVIQALHSRAIDKSDTAAKIYLTLSGDYKENDDKDDSVIETFREINKVLQGKAEGKEE